MKLMAQPAFVGARGIDCVSRITEPFANWLVANGFEFVCRYLGSLTRAELELIVGRGLAVMPVCFADQWDGPGTVNAMNGLGMPDGVTVWSDTESISKLQAPDLIRALDNWATAVRLAKFDPGGYFANDTLLTSVEMGHLILDHYWQGASKIVDRTGRLAEPTLETGPVGWCMKQACPGNLTHFRGRPTPVPIDIDFVYEDFRKRTPTWVVAA